MNTKSQRTGPLREQRGNAMVGALLILLVLSAMGATYVAMTKTETNIAGQDRRHVQSMFNAEAGVSEALLRMSTNDTSIYMGQPAGATPSPGWGRYLVLDSGNAAGDPAYADAGSDSLDNDGDGQVDESGERFAEVVTVQTGNNEIPYPWVRVQYRLDPARQVVLFGDHDNNPGTPPRPNMARGVPIIRVAAEGTQGTAQRRIQVEAVRAPFITPNSAIYTESDDFQFMGTQFLISGQDWNPETNSVVAGASEVSGIQTTANPTNISAQLQNNQINNVEGVGSEPSIIPAPYNYDVQGMIDSYKGMADDVSAGGTISNGSLPDWGSWNDYKIVYVTNDLHISGSLVGGGLLLLEGNLDVSGSFTWYGLVINTGAITFTGGGGDIHIYGSVISEGGFTTNRVGGNADVLYSSMALAKLAAFNPYRVSAWTELP